MDTWFGDFAPARFTPSLDVIDEDGALRVSVDLPGLSKSDVEVVADGDYLTVRGENIANTLRPWVPVKPGRSGRLVRTGAEET